MTLLFLDVRVVVIAEILWLDFLLHSNIPVWF